MVKRLFKIMHRYWCCQEAVTVVEYALIAAGLSAVIISVVFFFGDQMVITMGLLTDSMSDASSRIDTD